MKNQKKKLIKKFAFALSVLAIIAWTILGTGASIAWFNDKSNEVNNIFNFAQFELAVSHKLDDGSYEKVDSTTKVFDEEALYEPGYTQVVYLKVENKGTMPFDFKTSVIINGYKEATNVYNIRFNLIDHLKFGMVFADTEPELMEKLSTREKAISYANMPLEAYTSDAAPLGAGEESFVALVIHMPKAVGNEANYGPEGPPEVDLGLVVKAEQQH